MMIYFENGVRLQYMADGILGFDGRGKWRDRMFAWLGLIDPGLFTKVSRTVTRHESDANPGIKWWCENVAKGVPAASGKNKGFILSISGGPEELVECASLVRGTRITAIQLDFSGRERYQTASQIRCAAERTQSESGFPVIVKVSPNNREIFEIAEALGKVAKAISLRCGSRQDRQLTILTGLVKRKSLPVIASSLFDYKDIRTLRKVGASAFSFGGEVNRGLFAPTAMVRRDIAATNVV